MNVYQYAIARVKSQVLQQPGRITDEQYVMLLILMKCVERYKREGK